MSTTTAPQVTVFIPVHDRERYVAAAIESVLAQTFEDFELLVVDDGSTDGSRAVVRGFTDPRIRLVCNPVNRGIPATRNQGIELARGRYLAFLDSDDWAHPQRLARQVRFLDAHPDYAAVGAWIEWMDETGRPLGRVKRKAVRADDIAAERLFRSCLENSAAMGRIAVLRAYRHRERYELGSDYDLWARIAVEHKLGALPEALVRRRAHAGRTTREKADRIKPLRLQIFAEQLETLGVPFTREDLERHYLLRRMGKLGFTPDAGYLRWAEEWLYRLKGANAETRRYPEPAFSLVLGEFWLKVCWDARRGLGPRVWRRFWRSRLRTALWPGVRRAVRRHVGVTRRLSLL
jgi:glycosyltransferase involved in cell wall biosynthesis